MVRALENDVCGKSLTFVVFVYCLYTNERIPVLAVPWKFLSIFVPVHMDFLPFAVISFLKCQITVRCRFKLHECWPMTLGVGDMTVRGSIRETLKINAQHEPGGNARYSERTTSSGTSLGTSSIVS